MADEKHGDIGQAEVQAKADEANAKGYIGSVPDETPNEAYTVAGVTADPHKAADAAKAAPQGGKKDGKA